MGLLYESIASGKTWWCWWRFIRELFLSNKEKSSRKEKKEERVEDSDPQLCCRRNRDEASSEIACETPNCVKALWIPIETHFKELNSKNSK